MQHGSRARATRDELESFHTPHISIWSRALARRGEGYLDAGDTPAWRGVYEAAARRGRRHAASPPTQSWRAARGAPSFPSPVCITRRAARAAGFCVFNDCGVAVEMLRRNHGLKRIAYVDIDAHHGDGVFYGFENDPDLIFADIHEDGRYLYPGTGARDETGAGAARGTKLNIPVPPGADDAVFRRGVAAGAGPSAQAEPRVHPAPVRRRQRRGRPASPTCVSREDAHARAARELCALADELGHGRVLGTGGGGYNRINLARAWTAGRAGASSIRRRAPRHD